MSLDTKQTNSKKPTKKVGQQKDLESEVATLRALLEQRDFEIKNLTEKVEVLNNKVRFFQNECFKVTKVGERFTCWFNSALKQTKAHGYN